MAHGLHDYSETHFYKDQQKVRYN